MTDLLSLFPNELREFVTNLGEKPFRAEQICDWLRNGAENFDEMLNIPKSLRGKLKETAFITQIETVRILKSKIDETKKYLFAFKDGERVESVLMKYKHGNTVCISTQAGCRMGCEFCASTKNGLARNLTASEILLQVMAVQKESGERVSNIVLMGIGEPLDNYDNVLRFLKLVNHEQGLNIGYRHISLSTCGLVPQIKRLAEENIPVTLSVSLHASEDQKRRKIMPVANKYSIKELLEACENYIKITKRRISVEYALIKGFNDGAEDAHKLGKLLKGMLCHVNLIPVNPISEKKFEKSEKLSENIFTETLSLYRINVTTRRKLGGDIEASCGQLRTGGQ